MKNKDKIIRTIIVILCGIAFLTSIFFFKTEFLNLGAKAALLSLKSMLPQGEPAFSFQNQSTEKRQSTAEKITETTTEKAAQVIKNFSNDFTATPKDITDLINEKQKTASKDKKDGSIEEKQYISDGVTDKYGNVRVKNVNKTQIDIETLLKKKADLSVNKKEPSVLIYHTHTTETYQILDRDFYATGFLTRTNDKAQNMVRVGDAICEELEKAGYSVIHDSKIYDSSYSGAYARSRQSVEAYLKKYPSISVTLDIHRDAIELSNGTKIKPTALISEKKAAQIMIISGCQEEGNSVKNLPDWRYNLIFALQLQNKLEELFSGITRPLYFSPRSYNMNVTHCSLLVEVGSDANTLEEAVYTGKCLGKALSELLKEYEEK